MKIEFVNKRTAPDVGTIWDIQIGAYTIGEYHVAEKKVHLLPEATDSAITDVVTESIQERFNIPAVDIDVEISP